MKKRIYTRLAAGLLCAALLFTDAASLNVWAVSDDLSAGQTASLAEPGEESDTPVTNEEEEEKKETETSPEEEQTESPDTEETDENDAPVIEDDDEADPSVEEEQEAVSENTAKEDTAAEDKPGVNSVMETSSDDIASGTSNGISWVIDKDGFLTVSGTGDWDRKNNNRAPWYEHRESIKDVGINVTGMTDASYMFAGCSNLTYIELDGFDTSKVTDMGSMFADCSSLYSLYLSEFSTTNVTNMSGMFSGCESLEGLNMNDHFYTSKVTDMSAMFADCSSLTRLEFTVSTTANVTNMSGMFSGCKNLTELDLSSFDTGKVTNMSSMFSGCKNLTTLDLFNFDTGSVTDIFDLSDCENLTGIYTPLNLKHAVSLPSANEAKWYRTDGSVLTELPKNLDHSVFLKKNDTPSDIIASGTSNNISWVIDADRKLTVTGSGDFERTLLPSAYAPPWYSVLNSYGITTAEINVTGMTDASYMFYNCRSLNKVDLSNFDTSKVTDMSGMFDHCSSLKSLDLSNFDTSKVMYMMSMFDRCSRLTSLDLSNFDTSAVIPVDIDGSLYSGMFSCTDSLNTINTPRNLKVEVGLPIANSEDKWYRADGTEITELPQNLPYSILITKNRKPELIVSGKSNNISWKIDANGKLTVSGTGDWENKIVDSDSSDSPRWIPWYDDRESIKTAEINVTGMKNTSYMFFGCGNLTSIDLTNFDTSNVTNMSHMFNLSDWRSSGGRGLTKLDVSNFDTSNVTDMSWMFGGCKGLTELDVSNFDTSNVTDMSGMFDHCFSLTSLDLTSFNTDKVTSMDGMFDSCGNLSKLNISNFDTSNVTNMSHMFCDCSNLTELDLSSFDTGKADIASIFPASSKLNKIYTPRNVQQSVELPVGKWYQADGNIWTKLPQNLSYSILLTKNKKPELSEAYITAVKKKTAYVRGETVLDNDITVTYYTDKGTVEKITEGFTTNVTEINKTMSTPGKKTLTVSYQPDTGRELTAEIVITVTLSLTPENTAITLPDIQTGSNLVYNGSQHTPRVEVKLTQDDTVLAAGTDYTVSYKNNINAGTAAAVVKGTGVYSGTLEKSFTIDRAKVKIKAKDVTIAIGEAVPETFACEMTGFFNGDEDKVTGLSFSFTASDGSPVNKEDIDTNTPGIYTVTPTGATVGNNYTVDELNGYQPGSLIIAEERVVYTVTFNMMGHGTETAIKSVLSGQLIKEPAAPTAEGYLFTGWYKDIACTKAWDFAADTVLADTTLYARWVAQAAKGGIQIQEIPDQFYTGNVIKPVPAVYASDGTLLKAGKDYTVSYENNTNADQKTADGGTYNSLEGEANGFNADLPYVVIKGKGNHTGTVYTNFHIRQAAVSDAGGNAAAGFTLKYSDQLVTNAKNVQKPFSSLKYKKAMTAGKDYTVKYSSDNVLDADGNAVKAEDGGTWTVSGTYDKNNKYTLPAIPKGYSGIFEMTVEGIGNYTGTITREIYVTDKTNLIKNVTVTLGKNQKNMPYNEGRAVTLTPGWSDGKKYYKVSADGTVSSTPEANANDLFTVKSGKTFLTWGQDYTVAYTDNRAVGTAVMTITGIGSYKGSKSVTFKITGTAFKANTIEVKAYDQGSPNDNDFKASMPYTGRAITQNKVTLTTKKTQANPVAKTLRYGEHYTISYKNNIKKGTATMTFTAKPESGYSGSFNKTFKIGAVSLADPAFVKAEAAKAAGQEADSLTYDKGNAIYQLNGTVTYTREGAKPSQRIRLTLCDGNGDLTDVVLKEGTDYTVSYANNTVLGLAGTANKIPTMTFKGKGNYTGSLKVTFEISEAAMEAGADNLTVTAAATAYNDKKAPEYQYTPKITVKDGKKTLGKKDYSVQYEKCTQADVEAYLNALEDSDTTWETVLAKRPYAVIKALAGSGYTTQTGKEIKVYLDIYQTKLTGNNLYIIVSEGEDLNVYNGQPVRPDQVRVYYSADTKAIAAAKKAKEMGDDELTSASGTYKLTRLTPQTAVNGKGDYTLTYGANVAAGKNKGTVTVTGTGMYGGSVTTKFTILQRDVYTAP